MSLYAQKHDVALLASPWLTKAERSSGKRYLFKYARHPEREGYVFLVTDLESVHFESLTTPSLANRFEQVARRSINPERPHLHETPSQIDLNEIKKQTEESLEMLGEMFGDDWGDVTLELGTDDFFDAVYILSSPGFCWIFNTTELKDRQPLQIITRHLLTPVTSLLASKCSIKAKSQSSEQTIRVVTNPIISSQLHASREIDVTPYSPLPRRNKTPSPPPPVVQPPQAQSSPLREEEDDDDYSDEPLPSPSKPLPAPEASTSRLKTLRDEISASPSPVSAISSPPRGKSRSAKPTNGPEDEEVALPRPSQRERKEKEKREEEEETERRREELKKKMREGGGGARTKRRFGR